MALGLRIRGKRRVANTVPVVYGVSNMGESTPYYSSVVSVEFYGILLGLNF